MLNVFKLSTHCHLVDSTIEKPLLFPFLWCSETIKTTALYRSRKYQSNNEKNITSIPHFRLGFSNAEDVVVEKELIMEALAAAETPFLSTVDFLLFCQLFVLTLIQQYLFEVNVVGFSSREALVSDAGVIFPSWPISRTSNQN